MPAVRRSPPLPRPLREILGAVLTGLLSVLGAAVALRITPATLTERWLAGGDDATLHYMLFTSATQAFPYADNPDLGFPHGLNVFFSGQVDVASALVMAALSLVIHSGVTLLDVFDLLAFFGVGASAYFFFRALRVRPWIGVLLGASFSLAPYHFIRIGYGHAFIANYWAVPLAGILALVVAGRETDPFAGWSARASTTRARRLRRILPPLALAVLIATTGAYYFVFATIAVAGVWLVSVLRAALHRDPIRTLAVPTIVLGGLGLAVGTALVLFNAGYGQRYEPYFTSRSALESELYAGKLTTLLAPWTGTGIPKLGHLVGVYDSTSPLLKSAESPGMPVGGAIGLVLLMAALVAVAVGGGSVPRTWFGRVAADARVRILGLAAVWVFLFYIVTGLGIVVAVVVGPELRAWSRFSVFLILFGLGFVGLLLELATDRFRIRWVAAAVIVVVAVVDQIGGVHRAIPLVDGTDPQAAGFVKQADDLLPDGCGVVQLPLKSFPDSGTIDALGDYDEGSMYLNTPSGHLRWSYGSIRGTLGWDAWQEATTPRAFARAVAASGACAIEVDMKGYHSRPGAWKPFVQAAAGTTTPRVVSSAGRFLLIEVPGHGDSPSK
jgi:hypothetical protein